MNNVAIEKIIAPFLVLTLFTYSLRGKVGAIFITILLFLLIMWCCAKKRLIIDKTQAVLSLYIIVFSVLLQVIRVENSEYYLYIGYLAAALILFNDQIEIFDGFCRFVKYIALFVAFGVYLQRFLPALYRPLISALVPDTVVTSIFNRQLTDYYTGFSREVSYSMFMISIGLGVLLFYFESDKRKIKAAEIIFLFGALFISGKRATLLFFVVSVFLVNFVRSQQKLKVLKYIGILLIGIVALVLTYQYWSKIPALARMVELISYLGQGDYVGVTNGRLAIYSEAIELWKSNKWFGIGWRNFRNMTSRNRWYTGFDAHNCYLQVLCETGIVGSIIFGALIIKVTIDSIKLVHLSDGLDCLGVKKAILFIQVFFLLYCITEPVLYEYTDYMMYFISINACSILTNKD